MNASQIHLALTHFPLILSIAGFGILLASYLLKNIAVGKTGLYVLIAAGLISLPVYFSGEGTEEIIEDLPGISKTLIHEHEELAETAFIIMIATGLSAILSLALYKKSAGKLLGGLTLALALASSIIMGFTAHLGGKVSHVEIRNGAVIDQGKENESTERDEHSSTTPGSAVTASHEVTAHSGEGLSLNNGAKWKTDVSTRSNINEMRQMLSTVDSKSSNESLNQLSANLEKQTNKLVSECTMKGPDHDALHVWLSDFQNDLRNFKGSDNKQAQLSDLKTDIESFDQFFD